MKKNRNFIIVNKFYNHEIKIFNIIINKKNRIFIFLYYEIIYNHEIFSQFYYYYIIELL